MKFRFETNESVGNIFDLVTSINKGSILTARVLPERGEQQTFIVEIEEISEDDYKRYALKNREAI
jgi:hypothetical protein